MFARVVTVVISLSYVFQKNNTQRELLGWHQNVKL